MNPVGGFLTLLGKLEGTAGGHDGTPVKVAKGC
jgi:hypothetical protein